MNLLGVEEMNFLGVEEMNLLGVEEMNLLGHGLAVPCWTRRCRVATDADL